MHILQPEICNTSVVVFARYQFSLQEIRLFDMWMGVFIKAADGTTRIRCSSWRETIRLFNLWNGVFYKAGYETTRISGSSEVETIRVFGMWKGVFIKGVI